MSRKPEFVVTVKGSTTTWTRVKPADEPRRAQAEVEPEPIFPRRPHTGKPPFDTPEAKRNHELRKEYVIFWALWARGCRLPFPDHLSGVTCGAKTRAGTLCKQRALFANARCKFHGGLSTGPTSADGKRRASENWKCAKKHSASALTTSEPHDVLINADFCSPSDTQEPTDFSIEHDGDLCGSPKVALRFEQVPRNADGACEPLEDPIIAPRSQESSDPWRERDSVSGNQSKPSLAQPRKPVDETKKTSVRDQPSKRLDDLLAKWKAI